jgi:hypothetical protein
MKAMQRIFIKKCFLLYGGKRLSSKAVHSWVEKRGTSFADVEEFETEVWNSQNISMLRVSTP